MRLEKIKIAGFKSFVDPTTIPIPSQLVGIIGPNGCGKSNTIDAVRWVMGESSAKMLRGESMADVIFNGSNTRKPIGMATVELVFNNSQGLAGGQYAAFSQISVKRRVQREGQSQYFLNGTRCRRRDIADLFMGTGLGPRSYSIIEQGMISRLIEARPEDLRAFLEEAAGISKYKDRRKETERRIQHTRENLERLVDLIGESEKQLQHLKCQADVAEKFRRLKVNERQLNAELIVLKRQDQLEDFRLKDQDICQQESLLQQFIAEQRALEKQQVSERETHHEVQQQFNQIQGQTYQVGSDIAQMEQTIQYAKKQYQQLQTDQEKNSQHWQQTKQRQQQNKQHLADIQRDLSHEEPQRKHLKQQKVETQSALHRAEKKQSEWQRQWDRFQQILNKPTQIAQIEKAQIKHLEQQQQLLTQRETKMRLEQQHLSEKKDSQPLNLFNTKLAQQRKILADESAVLTKSITTIDRLRQLTKQKQQDLHESQTQHQTIQGQLASLTALQDAALKQSNQPLNHWLKQHGLLSADRIVEKIEVNKHWQTAVETILGDHLQAICIDDMNSLNNMMSLDHKVTLIEPMVELKHALTPDALIHQISHPEGLKHWLLGIRTIDSLALALSQRHRLAPNESFISPKGEWVGINWIKLGQLSSKDSGVLERRQLIHQLNDQEKKVANQLTNQQTELEKALALLQQAEQQQHQSQQHIQQIQKAISANESQLSALNSRLEQQQKRSAQLQQELHELTEQQQQTVSLMANSQQQRDDALIQMDQYRLQHTAQLKERDQLHQTIASLRTEIQKIHDGIHALDLRIAASKTKEQSLSNGLDRMNKECVRYQAQKEQLQQQIQETSQPIEEKSSQLTDLVQHRLDIEATLNTTRKTLEHNEQGLKHLDQQRHTIEQTVHTQRDLLEKSRHQSQESLFQLKHWEQQLQDMGVNSDEILTNLAEDATPQHWQQQIQALDKKIKRLGAVNLAAIDELKEKEERTTYLQAQLTDINESLTTLENAIRKIDRETRSKFKTTYEQVNMGLQARFPKLFGGGQAYLQLTEDDLLTSGVTVMAQPPGKRNTNIHLLSGGEKALTAVALVFSIFDLNPSPFCMLDEVDAPLDDANVGRFCELVKSMSEKVQFIFITHNKITMEIAHQLMGVTMQEPGVSRLVSVDLNQAEKIIALE